MKKLFTLILLLALFVGLEARGPKAAKKPWLEFGGKANIFLGEDDVMTGVGEEAVINPFKFIGLRYELLDLRFGGGLVRVAVLDISSLDALIYLPMAGVEPYIHAGLGVSASFGSGSSFWIFSVRGGMGVSYALNKKINVFAEPGILIDRQPETGTTTTFRLSLGARIGLVK
jgi:hypothetical protein